MKIFTSDLHFGHKRIVEFTNRAVECGSQDNHTRWLIDLWNTEVSSGDLVYHLGDFSFFKNYDDLANVVCQLKGSKIFIKGNHDRREHLDQLVEDGFLAAWYDYKEIKIGETSVCLFHFPVKFWHKQAHGSIHLHGHLHGANSGLDGKVLDIGLDNAYNLYGQHRFFTEEDIVLYMKDRAVITSYHNKERS